MFWVSTPHHHVHRDDDEHRDDREDLEQTQPVLITEEWLDRAGCAGDSGIADAGRDRTHACVGCDERQQDEREPDPGGANPRMLLRFGRRIDGRLRWLVGSHRLMLTKAVDEM